MEEPYAMDGRGEDLEGLKEAVTAYNLGELGTGEAARSYATGALQNLTWEAESISEEVGELAGVATAVKVLTLGGWVWVKDDHTTPPMRVKASRCLRNLGLASNCRDYASQVGAIVALIACLHGHNELEAGLAKLRLVGSANMKPVVGSPFRPGELRPSPEMSASSMT